MKKIDVERNELDNRKKIGVERKNREVEESIGIDGVRIVIVQFMIIHLMMNFGMMIFQKMIKNTGMNKKNFGRMCPLSGVIIDGETIIIHIRILKRSRNIGKRDIQNIKDSMKRQKKNTIEPMRNYLEN